MLEETDRLFSCEYCRVKSYLVSDDYFRYVLPHGSAENEDLIYFPYWRFKGMLFFCGSRKVDERFVDVSQQAILTDHFPFSVGVRSQAMKIQFVTPDTAGRFLKPDIDHQQIFGDLEKRFGRNLARPILHQAHIGETLSLIYSPFVIRDKLYDAILDKPVSEMATEDLDLANYAETDPRGHIRFVSTLCPHCGWDLEGERDALVLRCQNCQSTWYPVGKKLKQLKFAHIAHGDSDAVYLPFWRIRADISGIGLKSYADLIKVANLPKAVREDWHQAAFRFWIPAFKVRPRIFLRLASQVTVLQPRDELSPRIPDGRIHPSNLPVAEAIESLKLVLAGLIKPRKSLADKLPAIEVNAKSLTLIYFPFKEAHLEYIQPDYQIALNKNVLSLSRNL
jgi:hypothetical protein